MSCIMTGNGWVQLEPSDYTLPNDVFVDIPVEEVHASFKKRQNRFTTYLDRYMAGDLDYKELHTAYVEPARNAFTNPSPKYIMPYDGYKGLARKGIEV